MGAARGSSAAVVAEALPAVAGQAEVEERAAIAAAQLQQRLHGTSARRRPEAG
jgi:hypothetical protein